MLTQVWNTTGQKPEELAEIPDFPTVVSYLWEWFCELQESADKLISFQDIEAYARLTYQVPTPMEARMIRALSYLFNRVLNSTS